MIPHSKFEILYKGQKKSKWFYEDIASPKIATKLLSRFLPYCMTIRGHWDLDVHGLYNKAEILAMITFLLEKWCLHDFISIFTGL